MTEKNGGVQQLGQLVGRRTPKPSRGEISKPSMVSCDELSFAKAMLALTALKRTADFTEPQLTAWHAVLSGYKPTTINRAVLMICASEQRFPELADVLQWCRKIEPREIPYSPNGTGEPKPLYEQELKAIAARIGLEV
jgi:hypothetical protein